MAEINVLSELERVGLSYEWAGDSEVKVHCPFHDDKSPSCNINVDKRVFRCHTAGCKAEGDFIAFLAAVLKVERRTIMVDLAKRYKLESTKAIEADVIERYHAAIWDAKPLLKELHKRGVTDDLIKQYRLGTVEGRVSIPIKSASGLYVNVRKYLPGAPGKDKMRNLRGHGEIRLYPIEQLDYESIVLCGGECKAIVAAKALNRVGIGAITATAGEGNWDYTLTPAFAGKTVYICMDVDSEGQTAAQERCAQLKRVAGWVGNVVLPLDKDKYPHGDINDFIACERGNLAELLESVQEWDPPLTAQLDYSDPIDVELRAASNAAIVGKRIAVHAVITAMDTAPYVIPKKVRARCTKDQKECALCSVFLNQMDECELHPESPVILEMVNTNRSVQREALMRGLSVPATCKVVDFECLEYFNAEDTRVSPQLEITNRAADRVMQPAICIGDGVELNETYRLEGRMYPHPKTQQSTLLISAYKPAKDALSTYECRDIDLLDRFKPHAWTVECIQERLDALYSDLEANVTRIFQRRDLHLTIDLAYHSPLLLTFDGRVVKGWVEVLILGDSSQGKSETAMNLMRHYGLGEKVECKNASVAGLLGGLQQMGSRWFVTWGVIPTHDKRLVVLEELKGTSTEVIAKLTDMRSSGIAEIPKIEKRRTHARTRLVALSNPRSDQPLSSYNFGIESVKELIGGLEDIRRFDAAHLVSAVDIDPACLNRLQRERPIVDHVYTSEACRALILWAWTREPNQVIFEKNAAALVLDTATKLCEQFTDTIPLVDRGSMRLKVARLAAAIAGRTFSHDTDKNVLLVRPCHVEYVHQYLVRIYNNHVFGYADFTSALRTANTMLSPGEVKRRLCETPYPSDLVKNILHTNAIDLTDLQDWCGWDRHEALQLLSFLVRKHAVVRDGRAYRKTTQFIHLLKEMLADNELPDRPEFIPTEEF